MDARDADEEAPPVGGAGKDAGNDPAFNVLALIAPLIAVPLSPEFPRCERPGTPDAIKSLAPCWLLVFLEAYSPLLWEGGPGGGARSRSMVVPLARCWEATWARVLGALALEMRPSADCDLLLVLLLLLRRKPPVSDALRGALLLRVARYPFLGPGCIREDSRSLDTPTPAPTSPPAPRCMGGCTGCAVCECAPAPVCVRASPASDRLF